MAYSPIHNIERKTQTHTLSGADGKTGTKHGTSYDWSYRYNGPQPHAPTHIGERTFHYDANGNQEGWNHDKNNNRRTITWDDADRIQSIEDRGGETSQYAYDDQGQRVIKQARQGVTLYVNQFFTERNGSVGSKHVFVGTTRLVTKVTGGTNFIRSYDGYTESKTPPGQLKRLDQPGKTKPVKDQPDQSDNGKHLGQQKDDKDKATPTQGSHPGQGIYRRADRANAVAQNTCKNKHLAADHCAEEGAGGETLSTSTDTTDTTSEAGTNPDEAAVFEVSPPDLFDEDSSAAYAELIKVSMGEQLFYYHPDHLGSTSYVTRENGKIHEHIQYFPFGETWIQQGGNTEKSPYLFTSKELDEETGLYYYGARYYDPRTSVWQSADPIPGEYLPARGQTGTLPGMGGVYNSLNLSSYAYAHHNPIKLTDPDGRAVAAEVAVGVGILVVGGTIIANTTANDPQAREVMARVVKRFKERFETTIFVGDALARLQRDLVYNESSSDDAGENESSEDSENESNKLLKKRARTAEVGEKVATPKTHKDGFKKKGPNYTNKETGEVFQKSHTNHCGEYKVGPKPGVAPAKSNKTTVSSDGVVLKHD